MTHPIQFFSHSDFTVHLRQVGLSDPRTVLSELLKCLHIPLQIDVGEKIDPALDTESSPLGKATAVVWDIGVASHPSQEFFESLEVSNQNSLSVALLRAGMVLDIKRFPIPDLWILEAEDNLETDERMVKIREERSGSVVVYSPEGWATWYSRNEAFGNSQGVFAPWTISPRFGVDGFDFFWAGVVFSCLEEILGDNHFNRTSVLLDRESLGMRPLHLEKAVDAGMAVLTSCAKSDTVSGNSSTVMGADLLEKIRRQLRAWNGSAPQTWGGRHR